MTTQFPYIHVAALLFVGLAVVSAQNAESKRPVLRPTHEQLSKGRGVARASSHQSVQLHQVPLGEVTKKRSDQQSLVERSTIISYGEHWTLVPQGAVLHVPTRLQSRIGGVPAGRLLGWSAFYQRNRGWLRQQPVEVSHARGDKRLGEGILKSIAGMSQIVVATCQNGPISMKQAVVPEEGGR